MHKNIASPIDVEHVPIVHHPELAVLALNNLRVLQVTEPSADLLPFSVEAGHARIIHNPPSAVRATNDVCSTVGVLHTRQDAPLGV